MNNNERKRLTSLKYAGMESLFQRIIDAYEEYQGIPEYDRTPAREISTRTENGIEIFDGEHNLYQIEDLAVTSFFPIGDTLVMVGYRLQGKEIEDCCDFVPDSMINMTEFMSDKEAREWAEKKLSADEYYKIFGEPGVVRVCQVKCVNFFDFLWRSV